MLWPRLRSLDKRYQSSRAFTGSDILMHIMIAVQLPIKTPHDLTCAFHPDTSTAITGYIGTSVRLWEVEAGRLIREFAGHTERVWALAWSRDGHRILSGGWDSTARVWEVSSGEWLRVVLGETKF